MIRIETGADFKLVRHALGWSIPRMADELRLQGTVESVSSRIRRWERGDEALWGPICVAVEGFMIEHGLDDLTRGELAKPGADYRRKLREERAVA